MITDYLGKFRLMLNASKTKLIHFSKYVHQSPSDIFPQVHIKGTQIEVVETFKYLSIYLDKRLRFY